MPSLQELSSQSLVSSLGLSDIIRQREQEARQLGEITMLKGRARAEEIASKGRGRRGVFETLGTIGGTVGGALLGGPAGATIGAGLGRALGGAIQGGEAPRRAGAADVIQQSVGVGAGIIGQQRAAQQQQEIFQQQQSAKEQQQRFETATDLMKSGKYTPESVKEFSQTQDFSVLTPISKANEKTLEASKKNAAIQAKIAFGEAKDSVDRLIESKAIGKELAKAEFGRRLAGEEGKQLRNSIRNAMDGVMRFRTGAAISESELEFYDDMFFPKSGDSVATVKNKMNRLNAMIKVMNEEEVTEVENIFAEEGNDLIDQVHLQSKAKDPMRPRKYQGLQNFKSEFQGLRGF